MENYPASYYAQTVTPPVFDRTIPDRAVETCIIGGGLAGVATALDLTERGRSVLLLEGNRIGWGASGRSGGFCVAGVPYPLDDLPKRVGLQDARTIYDMSREAVQLVKHRIDVNSWDVDFHAGVVHCSMAYRPNAAARQIEFLDKTYGHAADLWTRGQVQSELQTDGYDDALFHPEAFTVHPLKMVLAMAAQANAQGAVICEGVKVSRIDGDSGKWRVFANGQSVVADNVVVATGAFGGSLLRQLGWGLVPIPTHLVATDPIAPAANPIKTPIGILDDESNYYRMVAGDRLLWGARINRHYATSQKRRSDLVEDIAKLYPSLRSAPLRNDWGGLMPFLRHRMPTVSQLEPRLWVANGFGGIGLALTSMAGRLIASQIAGEPDDRHRLFERFGVPFAGGPKLGRLAAAVVYWKQARALRSGKEH